MRKLIEKQQEFVIQCDNPKCDYTLPYSDNNEEYLVLFVNKPCPKCGENLLTELDFMQHQRFLKVVDFINRWFSWITIFQTKKSIGKEKTIGVHFHGGVKISEKSHS